MKKRRIESYATLLFGSIEACQQHIVGKIRNARQKKRLTYADINKRCGLGRKDKRLPTLQSVEQQPSRLNSLFFSLVSTPLKLGADTVIIEKLRPFLANEENQKRVRADMRIKKAQCSAPTSNRHFLTWNHVVFSIMYELDNASGIKA